MACVADAASHSPARIYIYKRYERFWHWSQALLIIAMLISGFEVHGSYTLLGFEPAVRLHTLAAWLLLTLWAFTIFWQFTTGEWRQYLPTHKRVMAMATYYSWGMFRGEPNPFHKTVQKKHNPLQRLAYLALLAFISPLIWASGLLYLFYGDWGRLGLDAHLSLEWVAVSGASTCAVSMFAGSVVGVLGWVGSSPSTSVSA